MYDTIPYLDISMHRDTWPRHRWDNLHPAPPAASLHHPLLVLTPGPPRSHPHLQLPPPFSLPPTPAPRRYPRRKRGRFPKHRHLQVRWQRGVAAGPGLRWRAQASLQTNRGVSVQHPDPGEARKYEGKGTSAATAFRMGKKIAVLGDGKRRGGKASFCYSLPSAEEAGSDCSVIN